MEEIWKDIEGYEGLYRVSNLGNIKSVRNSIILKGKDNGYGYMQVVLYNGKRKKLYTHRLVAKAFIFNFDNKTEVNHIDGNKKNNEVSNLEWCTHSENIIHADKNGLRNPPKGIKSKKSKKIFQIYKNGKTQLWGNITVASDKFKINRGNIIKCCKGKRATAGGYRWEYANE